ncbi:MAG: 50S ribosomal protein L4 [Rhodospirillaceae bacterium]|nr:50S ribosomal protein L4 [Rhodospirillaceae bacterium]MBT6117527.1 50S ribosomal protein L4 [Rhodospirillaceae bacterium]
MKTKVVSLENKAAGDIELDEAIFGVEVRRDILHRVVNWQLARRQAGTHKTKQRSEVTGTGAKPWRQKGLGRARAGSVKSPIWRGGGVTFGPTPRDHGHKLNKKLRKLGLCNALSAKQAEGKLVVLDTAKLSSPKTKELVDRLAGLGWGRALIIDGPQVDENLARAAANIPNLDVLPQQGANVYDILRRDTLVLTRDAVEHLQARLR